MKLLQGKLWGLWGDSDFRGLWAGETISLFGSQITLLALPLVAILLLHGSPFELGALTALSRAPSLLIGLFVGIWVDRLPRRPIMMLADVMRMGLVASVPISAGLGILGFAQLYAVAFGVGLCNVFFDVAYQSYLPSLVSRDHVGEGNAKLETSRSIARVLGPGVAGMLVQAITPASAMLLDAGSFIASAGAILAIRRQEIPPKPTHEPNFKRDLLEGLHFVLDDQWLRPIALSQSVFNLFSNMVFAEFVLYMVRNLGFSPSTIGLVFTAGGIGTIVGASLLSTISNRFGIGATITGAALAVTAGCLLIPVASVISYAALPLILVMQVMFGTGLPIYTVNIVSLRQIITPSHLHGRVNATMRFIMWSTIPFGAILGGILGDQIGLPATLTIGALGGLITPAWLYLTQVPALRKPLPAEEAIA